LVVQIDSIEREHVDRETERERKKERWAHYHVHAAFKIKKACTGEAA
jgi:hypothetical protein